MKAPNSQDLELTFAGFDESETTFMNRDLPTPTPTVREPATLGMGLIGVCSLLGYRRLRDRRTAV